MIQLYSVSERSCLSNILRMQLIINERAILYAFIIATFIIISGIRSATAEVEEVLVSSPQFEHEFINPFPFDFIVTLMVNTYGSTGTPPYRDAETPEHIANDTDKRNAATSRHDKSGVSEHLNIFRDVFVPDAVWSFDASTGAHFEHNSSELGSELDAMPEGVQKDTDFWTRPNLSLWVEDNSEIAEETIAPSHAVLQVASCVGGSAEHSNLAYCDIVEVVASEANNNYAQSQNNNPVSAPTQNNGNLIAPSTPSTSTQESQEPATTPALANNVKSENNLIDLSALSDLCVEISASCATTPTALIDSPPAPTDSPPAPTDSPPAPTDSPTPLTPPTPVISVGDPGSIPELPTPSTPPLVASPVPETSTWIMMIIGFGITIIACRRRAPTRIKRGTVGPAHTSPNGQWRC